MILLVLFGDAGVLDVDGIPVADLELLSVHDFFAMLSVCLGNLFEVVKQQLRGHNWIQAVVRRFRRRWRQVWL